ncbi:hypothetical protein F5876DRAFT_71000, partial [Lentinula aff. lateritia]
MTKKSNKNLDPSLPREDALPNPMAPAPPKPAPSTKKGKKQSESESTSVTQATLPLVSPMSGYPPPPPPIARRVPLPSAAPIEDVVKRAGLNTNEKESAGLEGLPVPHFPGVEANGVAEIEATCNNPGLHLPQDISGEENVIDYGGNHEQGSGGEQAEYAHKHAGNLDNEGEYNSFYGGYRGTGGYGGGGYGGGYGGGGGYSGGYGGGGYGG